MSTAKSTGASPSSTSGTSRERAHNDGSAGRTFTPEQKAAVIRVRRCKATAFYDILGLEAERASVDESGIKKAYRKQSLLTHPDKNGYEGADEAFKMVSRAFQILSDASKKRQFDQFGGDPDVRGGGGGAGGASASPFSAFARGAGGGGRAGGFYDEEISPEELFRQFFGGGMGMGGPFGGGGQQFMFNMGGGPGIRVHQFGGPRTRRRPDDPNAPPQTPLSTLQNLLPLLLLFIFPLLSSLFSGFGGDSTSSTPAFSLDVPSPPLTHLRQSSRLGVPYYVEPRVADSLTARTWRDLDRVAEARLVGVLKVGCEDEQGVRERLMSEATGWFSVDREKYERARNLEMRSCRRLEALGYRLQ